MKKKLSILAVLLLAVAISAYSVGGTFAKYTSVINGTSSNARVAKWGFTVDGEPASNTFAFNLFDTLYEEDAETAEEDVESSNSDKVIAPGTGGKFTLALANVGEVNAEYTIDFDVENENNIPIEFKVGNGSWTSSLDDISATAINIGADAEVVIQWRWAFEIEDDDETDGTDESVARDYADTTLGEAAYTSLADDDDETVAPNIVVEADIFVTQVD